LISEDQLARAVPHLERAVELSGDSADPEALRALARACHALDRAECTTRMYGRVVEARGTLADDLCFVAGFERHPVARLAPAYDASLRRVTEVLERDHDEATLRKALGRSIASDSVLAGWGPTSGMVLPVATRRALHALESPPRRSPTGD